MFPTKTSMTPNDIDSYYDIPDLFTPDYDEVHISTTFTWDKDKAYRLADAWGGKGKVKLGGVAIDGESSETMIEGRYLKKGITITTRGCPNNCSFCLVKNKFKELDNFPIGNILQDNNILASSNSHWRKVMSMLRSQRQISFRGGLESARVNSSIVDDLRSLRISDLWLAYDHPNKEKPLRDAVKLLSPYFSRNKLRCYVLIGYDDDTIEQAELRLERAWSIGTLPFAMLYKDEYNTPQSKEWRKFQRLWGRPAIIKSRMKDIR